MAAEVKGINSNDRAECVLWMHENEMNPMGDRSLLHGSFWRGKQKSGLIHSTYDGGWVAVIWRSPLELEH